jgi:GMP reductase
MRIEEDIKLDFSDVLIKPKRSTLKSRKDVVLHRTFKTKYAKKELSGIPIMNSNMGTCGTFEIAEKLNEHSCFSTVHKFYNYEHWVTLANNHLPKSMLNRIFFPMGMDEDSVNSYRNFLNSVDSEHKINNIMIDVANGYSEHFVKFIEKMRKEYPNSVIVAGNVATPEMTEQLILAGADIVKVGIGGGSCCTTRLKAGVGYPQLSAIACCADAAHGLGGLVIADGGCNNVSDFAKSFGAGADFVMSGSFFAATDEADCKREVIDGKEYCYNYGMSSKTAQDKFGSGLKEYRSSEGRTALIPAAGPTSDVIKDILGGVRSACTYVGASKLKELPKRTTFIRVNNTHNKVNEKNTIGF